MCGRRKIEKEHPEVVQNYGDMDFALVERIAEQLPPGIVVQFHNNGEPLLYPRFGDAVRLFENQIRCVDTNAKLIVSKADEIIDNLDTITISLIEDDSEQDDQYFLIKSFLLLKGERLPRVILRFLGNVNPLRWMELKQLMDFGLIAYRTLHSPMGSYKYKKARVMPEIGICLEALHHPSIDRFGNVSACVRFDPKRELVYGNLKEYTLSTLWNEVSLPFKKKHIMGKRDKIPYCYKCEYWGIPS
jgi:MoaA/NifB/PqqE/SkfB family radical SAM enzyme